MFNSSVTGLLGLVAGFITASSYNNLNAKPTTSDSAELVAKAELQNAVNKAILDSMNYENAIKILKDRLAVIETSGVTNDFLKLQLADLQENYDMLMTFARSRIPDLPTSFVVVEKAVNGLHFDDSIAYDRNVYDRNIKLIDGVIAINGVKSFLLPIYAQSAGLVTELKSRFNPTQDAKLLQVDDKLLSLQFMFGSSAYASTLGTSDKALIKQEVMCLIEFDKNIDLKLLLNNLVIGASGRHNNARWDVIPFGFVGLYRRNILAFKLSGHNDWTSYKQCNLVLKTLIGTQQLMVLSATLVDSKTVTPSMYAGTTDGYDYMRPSYILIGPTTNYAPLAANA